MQNNKSLLIIGAIVVVVIIGLFLIPNTTGSTKYDQFAQCLVDKGAKFYGAFWCPHCQAQKARFEASAHLLPYVECSTPDGKGVNQICTEKGIKQYPTWIFADGSELTGEVELDVLAEKTGCVLPSGETPTTSTSTGTSSAVPASTLPEGVASSSVSVTGTTTIR